MGIRAWSFFFMTDEILGFYNSLRWHLKLAYLPPNVAAHHIPEKQAIRLSEFLDHDNFGVSRTLALMQLPWPGNAEALTRAHSRLLCASSVG